MHWRYKAVSLAVCSATLTGCASFNHWVANSKTFHNREQDYLHQTVSERGPLKIPKGLQQPDYKPTFDLPEQSHTLKPTKGIVMTPPTFTNSSTVALQQTLDDIQAQLAQMRKHQNQQQSTASQSPAATEPVVTNKAGATVHRSQAIPMRGGLFAPPKPQRLLSQVSTSTTKTEMVTLDFNADTNTLMPPARVQAMNIGHNTDSDTLAHSTAITRVKALVPAKTVTMKNIIDDSASVAPKQQSVVERTFSVSMNQTNTGVPYISVEGNFVQVWHAIQVAIMHLGYRITQMDVRNGYLFIQPVRHPNQPSILLYAKRQGGDIHFILYDAAGNPNTTADAENMLSSLAIRLMQTS